MFSPEMLHLTALTKECFQAETADLIEIEATVKDIKNLVKMEQPHYLELSAELDKDQNNLSLIIKRTDFQDDLAESVIEKEFSVTKKAGLLRVVIYLTDLDDYPNDNNAPRKIRSYDYFPEDKEGKVLIAEFIQALSFLIKPEDKKKLLDNADFQTSILPIAPALKAALLSRPTLDAVLGNEVYPDSPTF